MLYRHVFDNIFTKFRGIFRVFVNFVDLPEFCDSATAQNIRSLGWRSFSRKRGENLVANATDTVAMTSPAIGCLCKSSQQQGSFWPCEGERAYTLLNPPLTVYFLQGSIYETFYNCCYYFRAVATLWPSSDVNYAMVMELSSKNYFKSS